MSERAAQTLACYWKIEVFNGFIDDATHEQWQEKADDLLADLGPLGMHALAMVMASLPHVDDAVDEAASRRPLDILDVLDGGVEEALERARAALLVQVKKGLFLPWPGHPGRSAAAWNELRALAFRVAYRRLRHEMLSDAFAYLAIIQMAQHEQQRGMAANPIGFVVTVTRNLMTDWFRRRARLQKTHALLMQQPLLPGQSSSSRRGSQPGLAALGEIGLLDNELQQMVLVGDILLDVPQRLLGAWLDKTDNHIKQIKHHGLNALRERFPGDMTRTLGDTVALIDPILVKLARKALGTTPPDTSGTGGRFRLTGVGGSTSSNGTIMNKHAEGADAASAERSTLRVVLEQALTSDPEPSNWWFATAAAGDQPADVHQLLSQHDPERMRQHVQRRQAVARRFQAELSGSPLLVTLVRNTFELVGFGDIPVWITQPFDERSLDQPCRLANDQESSAAPAVVLRLDESATPGHFDVTLEQLPEDCGDVGVQSMNPGDDSVFPFGDERSARSLPAGQYLLFYRQGDEERIWSFLVDGVG